MTGEPRPPGIVHASMTPIAMATSTQEGSDRAGAAEGERSEELRAESEILEKRRGGLNDGIAPERQFIHGTHLYWDQGPRLDMLDGDFLLTLAPEPIEGLNLGCKGPCQLARKVGVSTRYFRGLGK